LVSNAPVILSASVKEAAGIFAAATAEPAAPVGSAAFDNPADLAQADRPFLQG